MRTFVPEFIESGDADPHSSNLEEAIVFTDPAQQVLFLSSAAELLTGWACQEARGHPVKEILRFHEASPSQMPDSRKAGRADSAHALFNRSGSKSLVTQTIHPIRDTSGSFLGDCIVLQNVSRQLKTDRAVREHAATYRTLAEEMPHFVWRADAQGCAEYACPKWYAYTGITLEQSLNEGWMAIHHHEDLPQLRVAWQQAVREGSAYDAESRIRCQEDGSYRWFRCHGAPVRDSAGNVIRWVGTFTDIQPQKNAALTLKETDRRKEEFLAMLGHELRNPLAPLRNALEVLKRGPSDGGSQTTELHRIMERQVDHLARLVNDLLDAGRLMRGKIELQREEVLLSTVISRALETARPLLDAQCHEFNCSLPSNTVGLWGDPLRLTQIIGNLLSNAAKYTPPNGRIVLHAEARAGQAIIRVRDNGIGISPQVLHSIFDLFVQSECPREVAPSGLGIGLTLVRRLVEMHGGTVSANSAGPGHGSEFVVRLPTVPLSATQRNAPDVSATRTCRRILLIDDNADAARTLASLLELWGHEVKVLFDGRAAINAARAFAPDIVLLDLGLPGMSGYDVAAEFRRAAEFQKLVLIALSGYGRDLDRERSRLAGFYCHLVKPIDAATLSRVLESAIDSGTCASS